MSTTASPQSVPRVSVGMPAYNAETWIEAAIESILRQSLSDFEFIISDNGSTDRTAELCQSYAERDSRIRFLRSERNRGAVWNFNHVLAQATAPYFKWASANDLCHPDFLDACVRVLEQDSRVVLAYPRSALFTDDPERGEPYDDDLGLEMDDPCARFMRFIERIRLNNVMMGVMRRDAIRATPQEQCFLGSDVVMMAALTLAGRFHQVPRTMFYRRMDEASATSLRSARELRRHYDPAKADRMIFQVWRARLEYFRAVRHGPLHWRQKLRLYRYLARTTISMRGTLWQDTVDSIQGLVARLTRSHG